MGGALLLEYKPKELWIFAYGSLIWNPEFEFKESRGATAGGWHRSFCLKLRRWRGTRELPALMLALDRGGSCKAAAEPRPAGGRTRAGTGFLPTDFKSVAHDSTSLFLLYSV
jgi:glutathione-specific gamma-glutamylcyclotransferase